MSSVDTRVENRTKLAKALKTKLARATAAGLLEEDLDGIAKHGDDAIEADREQKAQLAQDDGTRSERASTMRSILERGDALRDRIPAVVFALRKGNQSAAAAFLAALSFSRFRLRDLGPIDPEVAAQPEVRAVERVEREDKLTLLNGLAQLAKTLLPSEPIVAELAKRGIDRETLARLQTDAEAEWNRGKNVRKAAEATAREAEAVKAQKELWDAHRRMIRAAVKGDADLERLYAEC